MAYEAQVAQLARGMIQAHGPLKEVVFLRANKDCLLVFADGSVIPTSGSSDVVAREYRTYPVYGEVASQLGGTAPLSLLAFGYSGTGPRCFATFLGEAGFAQTDVENVSTPVRLRADGSQVSGTSQGDSFAWADGSETPSANALRSAAKVEEKASVAVVEPVAPPRLVETAPQKAKRKLDCNQCGRRMRIDNEGVYIVGGGTSSIVKLRCDNCDITRFESRSDIDAELEEEARFSETRPVAVTTVAAPQVAATPVANPTVTITSAPTGTIPASRYCTRCGIENEADASFCSACGNRLATIAPTYQSPPSSPAPYGSNQLYAGFWRRLGAYLIDLVILYIGGFIIAVILGAMIGAVMGVMRASAGQIQTVAGLVAQLAMIVLFWLYFTLLESSAKQATIGKMALGIKVTDLNGNRISFGRANGRHWSKILSGIVLAVGYIMAGFTEKKQALHDMIASTLVVKKGS